MQLLGMSLLMVVVDGVHRGEVMQLKRGFEEEGALVLLATPQPDLVVESRDEAEITSQLIADLPFDAVSGHEFEGLVLPGGLQGAKETQKDEIQKLVSVFYRRGRPVIVAGKSEEIGRNETPFARNLVIREGVALEGFVQEAIGVLADTPLRGLGYRATMAS